MGHDMSHPSGLAKYFFAAFVNHVRKNHFAHAEGEGNNQYFPLSF